MQRDMYDVSNDSYKNIYQYVYVLFNKSSRHMRQNLLESFDGVTYCNPPLLAELTKLMRSRSYVVSV